MDTCERAAETPRSPLAQKPSILHRKSTSFENRMPAKGTGHKYHFANLSFRLRETTTFELNGHFIKSGVGGKFQTIILVKLLGRPSAGPGS